MEKLYYYDHHVEYCGYRHTMRFYGFLVKRKVDDYNDEILVFQPVASLCEDVHTILDDKSEWKYISGIKLKAAKKKELKSVLAEISDNIDKANTQALDLFRLYDRLKDQV